MSTPNASYSFTIRIALDREPGTFARVAAAIASTSGHLGAVDIARTSRDRIWRDLTIDAGSTEQAQAVVDAVADVAGVTIEHVSDRTFLLHLGGKLEVRSRVPLKTRDDLSMAYTPGVGRICTAIAEDPERAWSLTIKRNTVAVVSDGSAVLGLGDIGPEAAMPVMEGKAVLFKRFADVDAWPICLATKNVEEIIQVVTAIAPGFGGINLEDIAAPRCFEIERRLRDELDIPVFHDDQHGTAVVVLAALIGTSRLLGRELGDMRVVMLGAGAAGTAVARILQAGGVRDIIGIDRTGIIHAGRPDVDREPLSWWAGETNPRGITGTLSDAMVGADVFIGLSGPNLVTPEQVATMADDATVFAMANPIPEILPEIVPGNVRVMATGRSDYPNQINNVLCFPGIFRGALDVHATEIDEAMKVAAANAIAGVIPEDELSEDYIIPSVFNKDVAAAVAEAVAESARVTGMARRMPEGAAPLKVPGLHAVPGLQTLPMLMLAIVAALLLAACGGGDGNSSASGGPTTAAYAAELQGTMQQLDTSWPQAGAAASGSDLGATRTALADAADKLALVVPPRDLEAEHGKLVEGVRGMSDAVTKLEQAQLLATTDRARAEELTKEFADDPSFRKVTEATAALEKAGVDTGA